MLSVDADIGPDEAYQHLKHSRLLHSGNIRPPPYHHRPHPPSTKLESIAAATLRDSSATKLEKKGGKERKKETKRKRKVCFVWLWVQDLNYNGENICNCRHQAYKFRAHISHSLHPSDGFFYFYNILPPFFLFPLYSYFLCRKNGRHLFSTALNFRLYLFPI